MIGNEPDLRTSRDISWDPRTGAKLQEFPTTDAEQVLSSTRRATQCTAQLARTSPSVRGAWLDAVADALEGPTVARELTALADRETALGSERLVGELARTVAQFRFYAEVAREGSFLDVTIDRQTASTAQLARVRVPLGTIAVFGASNFPFAFGVLGNDTASAIAAGCAVVAKAHPAHPQLCARLGEVASRALIESGAPAGLFTIVSGFSVGGTLVESPHIDAVAFTGSQKGGLALWKAANARDDVIPVFAEMGTVNPVLVTPQGAGRMEDIASGFVGSFTLGAGQYCTKPGLLLAPSGSGAATRIATALAAAAPRGWALTEQIALAAEAGVDELVAAGATVIARAGGPTQGWSMSATVLSVSAEQLRKGSRLLEECFGPVVLVAEYGDEAELQWVLTQLQGALAAAIMTSGPNDPATKPTVEAASRMVGRVVVNEWPTGVAFGWAQHHGGPWPATSVPAATSVGAAAIGRFTRPVAFQNAPDDSLPPPLRARNPWSLPRRIDGRAEVMQ